MALCGDFKIGSKVRKITGDYHLDGIVRAVFLTADGAVRVVVGHDLSGVGGKGEILHIYGPSNLIVLDNEVAE